MRSPGWLLALAGIVAGVVACGDSETSGAASSASAGGAGGAGGEGGAGGAAIVVDTSKSCGHAHNDYEHDKPLTDALDRGFCSVEVDVFLVDGELLVGHTTSDLDPTRTIVSLYLDPLRKLGGQGALEKSGAGIGPHGGPLQLLIDVKTDAEMTYAVLDPLLATYSDILTAFEGGAVKDKLVTAVISGGRAQATMAAQALRYAAVDGRIGDPMEEVAPGTPISLVPLVSQDWLILFPWVGVGDFDPADREALDGFVAEAHEGKRLLRFWDTADRPEVWAALAGAEVDLINVDDLAGFEAFKAAHDAAR
jgi:hypothetical protein